jgi:acetylornithine deacetylase/succinyl-diaminopimelate desuccinylase-like protein
VDAIKLLSELLRLNTTNPPGNEQPAAELLESVLSPAGFKCEILDSPEGRPNLVARLEGPDDLGPLVLVSHTDVVPVETDKWTRDPFGGETADGFIWGRGALDMKGIAVMHVAAAIALAASGRAPRREVIVVSVADEEAGGHQGARWLTETHPDRVGLASKKTPVALGEGGFGLSGVLDRPVLGTVVGEKSPLWLEVRASGSPSHGSMPPDDMATRNLAAFLVAVAGYRNVRVHPVMRQHFTALAEAATGLNKRIMQALARPGADLVARAVSKKLRENPVIGALVADTISPTILKAGYKHNVVPAEANASLDCRLLPDTDPDEFVRDLRRIGRKLGVEVTEVLREGGPVSPQGRDFAALLDISRRHFPTAVCAPILTPGFTDLRFWRAGGGIAYGWVPLVLTRELVGTIHGHDERVPVADFELAVAAMTDAVTTLA